MSIYTIKYKDEILVERVKAVGWYRSYYISGNINTLNRGGEEILLILKRLPSCILLLNSGHIYIYKKQIRSLGSLSPALSYPGVKILWESEDHLQERVLDRISS